MSEIQDLLVKAEAHSLDMTKEMGSFYNQPIEELKHRLNCQDKIVFLKHLGLINNSAAFDLTDRELSCLHYLAKGFSCQQIARSIFLSARTVEHYIEILKEKFNCLRKTDLIDIAHLIHED